MVGTQAPELTDDWWYELVINNLSMLQRERVLQKGINNLQGLDLSELLRVFECNWYIITGAFFINLKNVIILKRCLKYGIAGPIFQTKALARKKVLHDIDVIICLMKKYKGTEDVDYLFRKGQADNSKAQNRGTKVFIDYFLGI